MHASVQTRPDLTFSTSKMGRFSHNPREEHLQATKHQLRYISSTRDLGITYGHGTKDEEDNVPVIAYSDASWLDNEDATATGGYIFMMNGGPVAWRSKKQTSVALSTAQAEYDSASEAGREAAWIRTLLKDLHIPHEMTPLYCDNLPAIDIANIPACRPNTKHFDMKSHYVRQEVQRGHIELRYIPSEDQLADAMTKPLPRAGIERFVEACHLNKVVTHRGS